MAVDIGPKIGIDGEKEFRNQLANVSQAVKVMGSEMKIVTEEFGQNAKSEEALTKQNEVLGRTISTLNEKLALQKKGLEESAKTFGEADTRTMKWQQAVNETEAALAKAERQSEENTSALKGLGKETDSAEKKTSKLGDTLSKAFTAGAKAAAAAVTAVATAAAAVGKALWNMAKETADIGDTIDKNSQKVGLSTEAYQKWDYAMKICGTEMSAATTGLKTLTNKFDDAKNGTQSAVDTFNRLGLEMSDIQDLSREDLFATVVKSIQNVKSETEKAALANDLFGKSGQDLAPMFNLTEEELNRLMDEADKYGMVMSEDAISASTAFKDSLTTLQGTFQGFKNGVMTEILPGLTAVTTGIADMITGDSAAGSRISRGFQSIIDEITAQIPAFTNLISTIAGTILNSAPQILAALANGVLSAIPTLMPIATSVISTLVTGFTSMLPSITSAGVEIVLQLASSISEDLPTLVPIAVDALITIIDTLISNADQLIDAALQIILALANGLISCLPQLLEMAPVLIQKLTTAIVNNAPKLLEAAVEIILALALGILENLPQLLEAAWDICKTLLNGIAESFISFVEMGGHIVEGFIQGWKDKFAWAWNQLKEWFNGVINKVKDWLGIHSPSKKFAEIGEYSAMGFGEGFDEEFSSVSQKVVGDIQKTYDKALAAARKSIDGQIKLFDRFADEVTDDAATVEQMIETWAEQTENLDRYTRNLKKAAEYGIDRGLVESFSDGSSKSSAYINTIIARIEELGVSTEGLSEDAQSFVDEFNNAFRRTGEAKDTFARTATEISGAADDIKDNVAAVNGVIAELQKQYEETYQSARDSIGGQVKLFDEFSAQVSKDTDTVEEMTAIWAKQAENLDNYTENLRKAASYGIDAKLIEKLSDGSAESVGYIATIVAKIEELGGANAKTFQFISDFNAAFQQTEQAKDNFATTVADIQNNFVEMVDDIQEEAKDFKDTGELMIDNMIKGLDEKCGNLYGKVMSIVNDAIYYANFAASTALPDASANAGVISSMQGTGVTTAMADSVNALGTLMSGNGSGNLNIVIQADGREFYRATLDDFRLVQSENPVIVPV